MDAPGRWLDVREVTDEERVALLEALRGGVVVGTFKVVRS